MSLRVAGEELVIRAELMVNLDVDSLAVRALSRGGHQVLVWPQFIDESGRGIRGREGVVRKEIVRHRVKPVLGDNIAGEWRAGPGSVRVLTYSGWVVDGIADLLARRVE